MFLQLQLLSSRTILFSLTIDALGRSSNFLSMSSRNCFRKRVTKTLFSIKTRNIKKLKVLFLLLFAHFIFFQFSFNLRLSKFVIYNLVMLHFKALWTKKANCNWRELKLSNVPYLKDVHCFFSKLPLRFWRVNHFKTTDCTITLF